jgi:hypothetical protein
MKGDFITPVDIYLGTVFSFGSLPSNNQINRIEVCQTNRNLSNQFVHTNNGNKSPCQENIFARFYELQNGLTDNLLTDY